MNLAGDQVGQHRDDARCSQRQRRDNLVVIAGINVQGIAALSSDLRHLIEIAAGFLDRGNVVNLRQTLIGIHSDIDASAGGHIVENDGQSGSRGPCLKMLVKSLL